MIIAPQGAIIAGDLESFGEAVDACIAEAKLKIVIDFRNVPFIDSAGLENVMDIVCEVERRGGDLRIASLNDVCRDIFRVTRLDALLQIQDRLEQAIDTLA